MSSDEDRDEFFIMQDANPERWNELLYGFDSDPMRKAERK
jgi:hypothetical protein